MALGRHQSGLWWDFSSRDPIFDHLEDLEQSESRKFDLVQSGRTVLCSIRFSDVVATIRST